MSANFKSVVSSLIDTLMKKSVANVSPGTLISTTSISESGMEVVSPCDGFAFLTVGSVSGDRAYANMTSGEITHQHEGISNGYFVNLHLPVKRGNNVKVAYAGFSFAPTLRFFSRVGGGINQILQAIGGGLCLLSHSFNRFSSSLVAKQCRAGRTLILQFRSLGNGANNLLRLLMGTLKLSFSTQTRSNFQTLQQPFGQNQIVMFPQGLISLSAKAINLTFISTTKIQKELISRSSKQSAQANLACEGGAL